MADEPCRGILHVSPSWHPEIRYEVTLLWEVLLKHIPANQSQQPDWRNGHITSIWPQFPYISVTISGCMQPLYGSMFNKGSVHFDCIPVCQSPTVAIGMLNLWTGSLRQKPACFELFIAPLLSAELH